MVDGSVDLIRLDFLESQHSLGVDNVDRRSLNDLPGGVNGAVDQAIIPPVPPGYVLFGKRYLQRFAVFVAVYTQQDKGLTTQSVYERPLVRVEIPARSSPVTPEGQHDDLASVITQLELFTKDVLTFNFRRMFPNRQMVNRE